MEKFLAGAHNIDEHFFKAPARENIPVIMGLLGVWNSTFLKYETRCLLPYSQVRVREERSDELRRRVYWISTYMPDTSICTLLLPNFERV